MASQSRDFFTVVTPENFFRITRRTDKDKSIFLIAEPRYGHNPKPVLTGEFEAYVVGRPQINMREKIVGRPFGQKNVGGEMHQTGQEHGRLYRLRPIPQKSAEPPRHSPLFRRQQEVLDRAYAQAAELFLELRIGGTYRFNIAADYCTGHHLFQPRQLNVFVPDRTHALPGLIHTFTWMLELWNKEKRYDPNRFRFTTEHIREIAEYAADDLRSNRVLKHNMEAGMVADALVGF